MIAFKTEVADITIGEVGQSFWDKGMLTTRLVGLGVSLLLDKFKASPTMVVTYHICVRTQNFLFYSLIFFSDFVRRPVLLIWFLVMLWQTNIWNGGTVGRSVKMMFSSKAEERVDKKDMVSNVFMCQKPYFVCWFL